MKLHFLIIATFFLLTGTHAQQKIDSITIVHELPEYDSSYAIVLNKNYEDFILQQIERGILYGIQEITRIAPSQNTKVEQEEFACRCDWFDDTIRVYVLPDSLIMIDLKNATYDWETENPHWKSNLSIKFEREAMLMEGVLSLKIVTENQSREIHKYRFKCGSINQIPQLSKAVKE